MTKYDCNDQDGKITTGQHRETGNPGPPVIFPEACRCCNRVHVVFCEGALYAVELVAQNDGQVEAR